MLILNSDSMLYIISYINFNDILNLSVVCTYFYKLLNEDFYKSLATLYYSKKKWKLAKLKPIYRSLPLKNYKQELILIEKCQEKLDSLNLGRWCKKDFYDYWTYYDYRTNNS